MIYNAGIEQKRIDETVIAGAWPDGAAGREKFHRGENRMDKRKRLEAGTVLPFSGMECEIDSVVGCGANAMVYRGHYRDLQKQELFHQVLIKELFPYEPDGKIYRNETGRICVQPDVKTQMELHRKSFERGNEVHLRVLMQHPGELDFNINTFELNDTLYTVLGFSGGRSLEQEWEKRKEQSLTELIGRIKKALEALEAFHDLGYLHLDISADNILLIGEGKKERVTLIDYNSVHTVQEIREGAGVYYSEKEGYTAPEVRAGRNREIGFASDLYAMTAVFYTGLTGKYLSVVQSLQTSVPEFADTGCLRDCPSTVLEMVRAILKKGLQPIARRRYQSVAGMLRDFEELSDRIEGKGITHWALWETGRERVRRTIQSNTAFHYICREEKLYPLRAATEAGEEVSLLDPAFFCKTDHTPVVLMGSGGMGKTTALLRMAYYQKKTYSPLEPAITYLSLFDWKDGGDTYIQNRILENLRFKPHTDSMETARHELHRLLSAPICTKQGTRPVLILLLDGLNEASGDISPLQKEISELVSKDGVRILLTSRSEPEGFSCQKIMLERLKREEVKKALEEHGILPPQNMELQELLHIPMLLSMYIRTALAEKKQLQIDTKEELLEQYFAAILEKEIRTLPENARENWGIQASVQYVLPEIAAQIQKLGRAISDPELLKLTENCYKELKKRALTAVFPEWIGHTADIKMDTENADAWYGKIILELLWKRLGLIVRDENGSFKILHQMMEEYLAERSRSFHAEFDRQKRKYRNWRLILVSAGAAGIALVLSLGFGVYNAHMLGIISDRNREIVRQESQQLAYMSNLELEAGNAREAAQTALSAISSAQENQQYLPEAEKALSDAAGIYQYSRYQVTNAIRIEAEMERFDYAEDGSCFVIMNRSDVVSCIDGKTGEQLWSFRSNEEYENTKLKIIEEKKAVLLAGRESAMLVSLSSGEMLWKIRYETVMKTHISAASLMQADEQSVQLVFTVRDGYGYYTSLQYVSFDTKSGKLKSKTKNLIEEERYRDAQKATPHIYSEVSDNQIVTLVLEFSGTKELGTEEFWVFWFDKKSGELIERSNFTLDLDDVNAVLDQENFIYRYGKTIFSPEGNALGTFVCFRKPGSTFYTEFLPEEEKPDFFSHKEIPACRDNGHTLLFLGDTIYGFGYGESIKEISYTGEIIQYIKVDEHTLLLVLSNGSIQYFDMEAFKKASILLNYRMAEKNVAAIRQWWGVDFDIWENKPLFYVRNSDTGEIYRCEITEDKNSRCVDVHTGLFRETTTYVTGNRNVVFSMNWDYSAGVCRAAVLDVQNGGTVEEFTLDLTGETDQCLGIAMESKKLLFQGYIYDWSSNEATPLMEVNIRQLEEEGFQFFDDSLLYTKNLIDQKEYGENDLPEQLYWMTGGAEHEIPLIVNGENVLEQKISYKLSIAGFQKSSFLSKEDFITGKSGLLLFRCSDAAEDSHGRSRLTHYMVYSTKSRTWNRIDKSQNNLTYDEYESSAAVGAVHSWIAMADANSVIDLYDAASNTYVQSYALSNVFSVVKSLQFICDDRYLLVRTEDHTIIIDVSSGDEIYNSYQEYCGEIPSCWWNREAQELYVYCRCGSGYCIDTDSWTEKYEVNHLAFISDQLVAANYESWKADENGAYDTLVIYPHYNLEEKIRLARERFSF